MYIVNVGKTFTVMSVVKNVGEMNKMIRKKLDLDDWLGHPFLNCDIPSCKNKKDGPTWSGLCSSCHQKSLDIALSCKGDE